MIAHLTGKLFAKHATSVVLDVQGVGYEVTIPVTTFYDLAEAGAQVSLRIYTHVREDALQLFGCARRTTRGCCGGRHRRRAHRGYALRRHALGARRPRLSKGRRRKGRRP